MDQGVTTAENHMIEVMLEVEAEAVILEATQAVEVTTATWTKKIEAGAVMVKVKGAQEGQEGTGDQRAVTAAFQPKTVWGASTKEAKEDQKTSKLQHQRTVIMTRQNWEVVPGVWEAEVAIAGEAFARNLMPAIPAAKGTRKAVILEVIQVMDLSTAKRMSKMRMMCNQEEATKTTMMEAKEGLELQRMLGQ